MSHLTVISYGGGVQTAALAVLAVRGEIPRPDLIVFADPGHESKRTYAYNETMQEWLRPHGLKITVAQSHLGPLADTLEAGKLVIPSYGSRGGQGNRACTERWKIRVVRKVLRQHGATTADVMLGISLDEIHRAKDSDVQWATNTFPLLDLRITRADCLNIIAEEGLPEPPKSACTFCPFRTPYGWARLKEEEPEAWQHAVELEESLPGQFLNNTRKPLPVVTAEAEAQGDLLEDQGCTSGYCFV